MAQLDSHIRIPPHSRSQPPALPLWALTLRCVEFATIFGGIPLLFMHRVVSPGSLMPFLVLTAAVLTGILLLDPSFDRRRLFNASGARSQVRAIFWKFLLGGTALLFVTFSAAPDRLFGLPYTRPGLYAIIMVFYPLASVYPQEIIFRTFLFHRYQRLFRHPAVMIAASAAAFAWAHVFFDANLWITMGLTAIGGILFAWTYHRSRSTLACALEHALYGDFLFTIGLGWYFYTGSMSR